MSESTCRLIGPIIATRHLDETPPDGAPCERPRHAVPRRTEAHESLGTRHHGETILNCSVPSVRHLYLPLHNTLNSGPAGGTGRRVPCPSCFLDDDRPGLDQIASLPAMITENRSGRTHGAAGMEKGEGGIWGCAGPNSSRSKRRPI